MVEFNGFQNLQVLSVSYCELTGELPLWLSKLKKLRVLNLSLNRITGSIPSWLGTLPRLTFLDLQSNLFSGEFPKELCRLPIMVSEQVSDYLSLFPTYIWIKNNSIHGNIPTEVSQLQFLRSLDLSFNNFSGDTPNQISNLINLERLDHSMNQLSGEIPTSITSLTFLASFNVSHNNLQGLIPKSTQLQGFDVSAFEGNPKLCGAPLPNECPREIGTDEDDKKTEDVENEHHQVPWFYVSVGLGFIFGFWGVCGSLVLKKSWRYAYFKFFDKVQDRLYVMIMVRMRMQRR
ncbi:putative leucine-rich repeat domain, L domain-containing protein [Rosa chinensis]|uniref:Putative leucine-rich repeat domain, L domain-containing protein n=1 Tax=Rosa chinensis TaxID=74649 RepID=A0A2P6PPA2_ROSCH|nr:putative leucine-rich repeat domain, L domain-containing protein [Rosa chinensis]